jgi:Tfp pilus assembly protein PilV
VRRGIIVQSRSRPPRLHRTGGFTVIEVVVAITVLIVALLGAAALFSSAIVVSGNTRNRVVATNLATAAMENVRGMAVTPAGFLSIPQGGATFAGPAQQVNGIQYTVKQSATMVPASSTSSTCDLPPASAGVSGQILQVAEVVTWPSMAGTKPIKEVTTLAAPVGAYAANAGALAVKVFDSTSNVAASINVQIVGPVTTTEQTTAEGCAYFYGVPPGTYTATVIQGTGIGDQEIALPSQTASVTVGQTASVQFQYDTAAKVSVAFPTTPSPASNMMLSVANTGLQPYGQFSFATSAYTGGTVVASPNLFPYASGYTLYAGNCTDNNPLGKDTNRNLFYPSAAPVPISVTPGNTTTAAGPVPLYPVTLHVQNSSAVPVVTTPTASETTTFAAPYGAVCTNGTATGIAPTLGLVTTNATGDSVTALPLGHFTITATCTKPAAPCPSANKVATRNIWVKPDGVYAVAGTGAAATLFAGPITMVVT